MMQKVSTSVQTKQKSAAQQERMFFTKMEK